MTDLELVSTDDLLEELLSRVDHGIFSALQTGTHGGNNHTYIGRWTGNTHTCIGLGADLNRRMLDDIRSRSTDAEPEEG